jgi:hypothetical protein
MPGQRSDLIAVFMKDSYKAVFEAYDNVPTVYDQVYQVKTGVMGAGDKMTQIVGAGPLARHATEGQDVQFKSPVEGWSHYVKYWTYSDGLAFTKEASEDSVKFRNLIKDFAATWGEQVRVAKEELAARIFNVGGATSGDWSLNGSHTGNTAPYGNMAYDNKPLFNLSGNTRATKGGGTYYNSIAGLDITPGDFERIYNLHTATNNRNERDQIVKNPADTILVKPGASYFKAWKIVNTERGLPGGDLNDANPYYKLAKVIAWDYLTDTDPVAYVGKAKSADFQFHERQNPEIRYYRHEPNLGYHASINIRIGTFLKNFRVWSRLGGTSSATYA